MKKIIATLVFLALSACAPTEHFLGLTKVTQPKTVMIEVDTIVKQLQFEMKDGNLEITVATAPVTIAGAGVFISPNGHILTCAHLFTVGPNLDIRAMRIDGSTVPATLVYISTTMDLGMLKVEKTPYGYAKLTQKPLQVGQEVLAIGSPFGLPLSVSHGIISAKNRGLGDRFAYTQDDAAINPGNSGGPLFDLRGELVGITILKGEGEGLSFAVLPEVIDLFLDTFRGVR